MSNQGFKNAPTITEFKRGMRVYDKGLWWLVVDVQRDGAALIIPDRCDYTASLTSILTPPCIRECDIDLNSIWIGREYRNKAGKRAAVLTVSSDYVGMSFESRSLCLWRRDNFLQSWEPIPLIVPADWDKAQQSTIVQPATSDKETWTPKAGEWCEIFDPAEPSTPGMKARVIAWDDVDQQWIVSNNRTPVGLPAACLRPLPVEPPVKVCPHCGSEARALCVGGWWAVECSKNCRLGAESESEAVNRWNKRVEAKP